MVNIFTTGSTQNMGVCVRWMSRTACKCENGKGYGGRIMKNFKCPHFILQSKRKWGANKERYMEESHGLRKKIIENHP